LKCASYILRAYNAIMTGGLSEIFTAIAESAIEEIAEALMNVEGLVDSMANAIGDAVEHVAQQSTKAAELIGQTVMSADPEQLAHAASAAATNIVDTISKSDIPEYIKSELQDAVDTALEVQDAAQRMVEDVPEHMQRAADAVKRGVQDLPNQIEKVADQVTDRVDEELKDEENQRKMRKLVK
jgi:aldehyde:ferredoxin oxidoreductase